MSQKDFSFTHPYDEFHVAADLSAMAPIASSLAPSILLAAILIPTFAALMFHY